MTGIALAGIMGAGKSTVGARLAARAGLPFVDTDRVLADRFGPIAEQFRRDGEAAFRAREAALVAELCDGVARVVATGGGLWANPTNRRRLREGHRAVLLDVPVAVAKARVGDGEGRPLAGHLEALLAARWDAYHDVDLVVDGTQPVEDVVRVILEHPWV